MEDFKPVTSIHPTVMLSPDASYRIFQRECNPETGFPYRKSISGILSGELIENKKLLLLVR